MWGPCCDNLPGGDVFCNSYCDIEHGYTAHICCVNISTGEKQCAEVPYCQQKPCPDGWQPTGGATTTSGPCIDNNPCCECCPSREDCRDCTDFICGTDMGCGDKLV